MDLPLLANEGEQDLHAQWKLECETYVHQNTENVEWVDELYMQAMSVAGSLGMTGLASAASAARWSSGADTQSSLADYHTDQAAQLRSKGVEASDAVAEVMRVPLEGLTSDHLASFGNMATANSRNAIADHVSKATSAASKSTDLGLKAVNATRCAAGFMLVSGIINLVSAVFFVWNASSKMELIKELAESKAVSGLGGVANELQRQLDELQPRLQKHQENFAKFCVKRQRMTPDKAFRFLISFGRETQMMKNDAQELYSKVLEVLDMLGQMRRKTQEAKSRSSRGAAASAGGAVGGVVLCTVSALMTSGASAGVAGVVGVLRASAVVNGIAASLQAAGCVMEIENMHECDKIFTKLDKAEASFRKLQAEVQELLEAAKALDQAVTALMPPVDLSDDED